jgi:hypothetical protein
MEGASRKEGRAEEVRASDAPKTTAVVSDRAHDEALPLLVDL